MSLVLPVKVIDIDGVHDGLISTVQKCIMFS
jgi:hypothetical protein